jgi:hypothetical protein
MSCSVVKARERASLVGTREPAVSDDIRNQDRRELSGLAHCAPLAVARLAQMPVPVCLFRRKDRSRARTGSRDNVSRLRYQYRRLGGK